MKKLILILTAALLVLLACIPAYAAETVSQVPGHADISVHAKYVANTGFSVILTDDNGSGSITLPGGTEITLNGAVTFTTNGSAFYALCTNANGAPGDSSPQTGGANGLTLWIALLLISGGVITGVTVAGKKKKYS